jgi:DNA-binding FadR family transcriptional regulator
MVESRPGVAADPLGFMFIKNKRKLVEDLLEVRMLIEPRIAALAALAATPEHIAAMQTLAGEVERLIHADSDHTQKDIEFHTKIAESSGNLVLPTLLPIIQQSIFLFVNITNRRLRSETIETHRAIVEAIEARDPIAASDAMTLHIIYNRDNLHKIFTESQANP